MASRSTHSSNNPFSVTSLTAAADTDQSNVTSYANTIDNDARASLEKAFDKLNTRIGSSSRPDGESIDNLNDRIVSYVKRTTTARDLRKTASSSAIRPAIREHQAVIARSMPPLRKGSTSPRCANPC